MPASAGAVQVGQSNNVEALEFLQQALSELVAVASFGRRPAQMPANGLPQLVAVQLGQAGDRLLAVGHLLAGETAAEDGSAPQVLDTRVHRCSERETLP